MVTLYLDGDQISQGRVDQTEPFLLPADETHDIDREAGSPVSEDYEFAGEVNWVENDRREKVFKVDSKALRVRKTLKFEDAHGKELCKIQGRMLRVKESMEIEGPGGERMAMVKKALVTPLRDRWTVKIGDGPDLDVQDSIPNHDHHIGDGRDKVAEVSKKWFRLGNTYSVAIDPSQNDVLILAITVAIDRMVHEGR